MNPEGKSGEAAGQAPPAAAQNLRRLPGIVEALLKNKKTAEAEIFLESIRKLGGGRTADLCFASALIDIENKKHSSAEKKLSECLNLDPEYEGARRALLTLLYPYKKKCSAGTLKALLASNDGKTSLKREFLVCCCLGEYRKAFCAGERLNGNVLGATELTTPWEEYFTPSSELYLIHYKILSGLELPVSLRLWQVYYLARLAWHLYPNPFARLAEALSKAAPKYGWMHLAMAISALQNSKYAQALKALKKVLDAIPGDWRARCLAAEAYLCLGDAKKAFAQFKLAAGEPGNAGKLWNIYAWEGELRLFCGNYRQAYLKSDAALKLHYDTMQLGWKGAAALKLGKAEEALNCLNAVVSEKTEDLEARVWRAEAWLARLRFKKAREDLEYVLRTDKRYLWAYLIRGILNYRTGKYREMREDFFSFESILTGRDESAEYARGNRPAGDKTIYKLLLRAQKSARGLRRRESHLLPLLRLGGRDGVAVPEFTG